MSVDGDPPASGREQAGTASVRVRLNWRELKTALREQVVGFVREMRVENPGDHFLGAALFRFYAEVGGIITWPLVGVLSAESLASSAVDALEADIMRWQPANWSWWTDSTEAGYEWEHRIEAAATAGGSRDWWAVHARFLDAVVSVCAAARRELVDSGVVGEDFVVIAMDEEDLLPRTLPAAQFREHFPGWADQRRELDRLAALPASAAVAGLIEIVEKSFSPSSGTILPVLKAIGPPAVPTWSSTCGGRGTSGRGWQRWSTWEWPIGP